MVHKVVVQYGDETASGGKGGYSMGNVYLEQGTELYVVVGGQGTKGKVKTTVDGGYNGGGKGTSDGNSTSDESTPEASGGGGGATHIAINNNRGVLANYSSYQNEVLLVAGGGGGASYNRAGGAGGGATVGITSYTNQATTGQSFGQGKNGSGKGNSTGVGGGGGGWAGGLVNTTTSEDKNAGQGGSGHIGTGVTSRRHVFWC